MHVKLSPLLQARINIFICQKIGWGLARFYIFLLGKIYYFFNHREKQTIQKVLDTTGGNRKKTARLLGVSYKSLLNKIKAYDLS